MAKEKTPRRSLLELPLRAQTSLRYFGFAEMGTPLIFARSVANSDFVLAF
jgi:hypothetical protein